MPAKRTLFALAMALTFALPQTASAQTQDNTTRSNDAESMRVAQRQAQQAEQQARAQEAALNARMRTIEARIEQQEKLLEQRMTEAARLRQDALQKNDMKQLERIADYEKRAIAAYESALTQLIKAMESPVDANAAQQQGQRQQGQQQQRGQQQGGQQQRGRQQPPQNNQRRRGWSWWPFG